MSILKDGSGSLATRAEKVANGLCRHWQDVFNKKTTDDVLRGRWPDCVKGKMKVELDDLRPTTEEAETVIKNVADSTAGPDGISSAMYTALLGLAPGIFLELVNGMIDGTERVSEEFNFAIMCCIPKTSGELTSDGIAAHTADATRPISVVDAANRMLAAMFKVALERCVGSRISTMQRGVLTDRSMLLNIIDIDFAAQKVSIKSKRGALALLDFQAALPSMDHGYIWDTLATVGLPIQYVAAIRQFYERNSH